MKRLIVLFALMIASQCVLAAQEQIKKKIVVQALFTGKAVVMIDDQRRILKTGIASPEGVTLIATKGDLVTLEIDGVQKDYPLGSNIALDFAEPEHHQEKVYGNNRNMFLSVGSINGYPVRFLLDTGATSIAMNKLQAKQLGVNYRIDGEVSGASTASGFVKTYRVTLKSVSLGKITQRNVEAMVIDGEHPGPILLGMSFLGKLKVEKSGNVMTLQQKQ